MITCPSCHNEELVGALFCSACGAQLTHQTKSPTETVVYTKPSSASASTVETRVIQPDAVGSTRVAMTIGETGVVISLEGGQDFTIGRVSGTQPILPDIDLTPYRAYEGGVSRLHATLRLNESGITISDLGSANGTRINGSKIPPYTPYPLSNGDQVAFGKFKVEMIINQP